MNSKDLNVFHAKRKLYVALLRRGMDESTPDRDLTLTMHLASDPDIQSYLQDAHNAVLAAEDRAEDSL